MNDQLENLNLDASLIDECRLSQYRLQRILAELQARDQFSRAVRVRLRAQKYRDQTIAMNWHGVSLYGEWPTILGRNFFNETSEDGIVVPGMALCVESYVGEIGGPDGVKLEEQVMITKSGIRLLSSYPFGRELLQG